MSVPRTAAPRRGPGDRRVRTAAAAGIAWICGYAAAVALTTGHESARQVVDDGLYLVPVALAAVLTIRAARSSGPSYRGFWTVLAVSNVLWLLGELAWGYYEYGLQHAPPFPSVADGLYLTSYALVPVAVVLGFRHTRLTRAARALLDAGILAIAAGYAGWRLLLEPQLAGGMSAATLTGMAYPLVAIVILTMLASLVFGPYRSVPRVIGVVAGAFAIAAVTDASYTYTAGLHDWVDPSWLNVGWQVEAVALCLAALYVAWHPDEAPVARRRRRRDSGLAVVLAGVAGTLAVASLDTSNTAAGKVAVFLVVAMVVLRLWLTSREETLIAGDLERALREQERLAVTDALTALHNRRFFEEILRLEGERIDRSGGTLGLIVLDLDRFKQINDRHGHPAGDTVLREVARRLATAARTSDVVARYGGEEFVVLLKDADMAVARQVAERLREVIGGSPLTLADGQELTVTASVGIACLPGHATSVTELVRAADQALYIAKRRGRDQVRVGVTDSFGDLVAGLGESSVLDYLQNLADDIDSRQSTDAHSIVVAAWAAEIAEALGLDAETRWLCVAASRFHDVGKVTVPDAVLAKPGGLTAEEWALIREHPEQGARLVALHPDLADVAPIVRDHHERPDGTGYPAGKRADEISIGARVVAVCDAWAAMRAARHYRAPLSVNDAATQLRAGAGTQFDATVVETFLRLVAEGRVGELRACDFAAVPEPAP